MIMCASRLVPAPGNRMVLPSLFKRVSRTILELVKAVTIWMESRKDEIMISKFGSLVVFKKDLNV
jgi:hypothetical protein